MSYLPAELFARCYTEDGLDFAVPGSMPSRLRRLGEDRDARPPFLVPERAGRRPAGVLRAIVLARAKR